MKKYKKRIKIPITKYNPIYRNELGHYLKDEWTSISDIGTIYNGFEFTFDEYVKVENLYVKSIFLTLDYFKSKGVKITHIYKLASKKDFKKYKSIELFDTFSKIENDGELITNRAIIEQLIRLRLREFIVQLELTINSKKRTEILFGYDYYMYLKTNQEVETLLKQINKLGLFTN